MLWEIDLCPRGDMPDREARRVEAEAEALGLARGLRAASARAFLLEAVAESLTAERVDRLARELFADMPVESPLVAPVGDSRLIAVPQHGQLHVQADGGDVHLVQVLFKSGVMDPAAQSAEAAVRDFGWPVQSVRTFRKYWIAGADAATVRTVADKLLANSAIEQVVLGPLPFDRLHHGSPYQFALRRTPIANLDDAGLMQLSRGGQLYLQLAEMQTIQRHFGELGREPTDVELETIAQTWSEHCSHKTLAGRIAYRDEQGERQFDNMLKETIFAATQELRRRWGDDDWCVSVFRDNAGIVQFERDQNLAFKVETHNHPSALEPYGGANTGLGGVIRDIMGTGLGAKPVANTDVFCFAAPDTPAGELPPGTLHPRRVMHGVVEGVRDYGNRMGIPTVNGAVYFDRRYLGNPLVYCGCVGLIPHDKSFKEVHEGDFVVAVGGRTGRDGIHGATFSSAELTNESESLSGGAVQIGNAIEEKKVLDVLLTARDRGLFTAVTDCGAGGFSSAVGEMGEHTGAEVHLDRAPLKYAGLSYDEIWISEAQERMVLSVPEENWPAFRDLCASEDVEATVLGTFGGGRLVLKYAGEVVGELSMEFLHKGRPPVVRRAEYVPRPQTALTKLPGSHTARGVLPGAVLPGESASQATRLDAVDASATLLAILGSLNVASKQWIIRQYDHEVQGGSVVKPLVGVALDGPSDAAVFRPLLDSRRGAVVACGMNPRYGDFDPYHMASSAIDEAVRNCVAVGADPRRIAILDNFCWGDCERSETLGSLVRAAIACRDVSLVLETPFISGKDSLNNEFSYVDPAGARQTIAIPPSLLISALGQIDDVASCVTMDCKRAGDALYLVGLTRDELGGSHYSLIHNLDGGQVPTVDAQQAKRTFAAVHRAIAAGCVAACHDLSEGGLAVAAAEMAFAGALGVELSLDAAPVSNPGLSVEASLFGESNTRFLCEVPAERCAEFERLFDGVPVARIGQVGDGDRLRITRAGRTVVDAALAELKEAWQRPLRW
jgi:phosphoribosylformylglycinamidine synthase